ncbi:GLPGLI family protein [Flavobacterium sp.]|jgi:GLPGLI family protein|uniref:GLPGLI family protein n=1 Tax=Flavobacterium sp. TaxID=239 RepID=UPI0037BEE18D
MKNSYLVIFFYFTFLNVFSQNGIVFYEFTDAIGVGGGNGEIYNAYTMFTKDKSYYVVGKDSLENAISKSKAKEFYNNKDGSYNTISSGLILTAQGQQVVCDYKTKTLLCNVFDGKHTYVKEPLPNIKWKITKQKKKIGSFDCILGTTYFRGRKYFAWYTPDVPVYSGPWKLNGLPGLILEAYDEGEFVKWNFKSYKFPVNVKQNYTIRKDKNSKKAIKFLNLNDFKQYCINKIESDYDRLIVIAKEHPGMTPVKEPITSYYLESFE